MNESLQRHTNDLRDGLIVGAIVLVIALGIFLAWPTTTPECPTWEVWVVNETGQPMNGMNVLRSCHDYSAEMEGNSTELETGPDGHVVFGYKSLTVSRFSRLLVTLDSAQAGVHASFGPHAYVFAFGNGLEGYDVYDNHIVDWRGAPNHMVSRIVVKTRASTP